MAHIRRHPVDQSKWQARYIDPTGRERSKTFSRKVDAERFLIHVEAQKQRAEWIDPELSATRFGDWAAQWLATRSHLKPKTRAGYESLFRGGCSRPSATSASIGLSRWPSRNGSPRCVGPAFRRRESARLIKP